MCELQDCHVKSHDKNPAAQATVKNVLCYLLVLLTLLVICGFVVHDHTNATKLEKSLAHAEMEIKQLKDALHMNDSTSMYLESVTESIYQSGLIDQIKRDSILGSSTRKYRRKSDDKIQLEDQMRLNKLKKSTYYPKFTSTCVKFINVSDTHEILYEMPVSDSVITCTWVLWSVNQTPMHISFNKSERTPLDFLPTFSAIIAEDSTSVDEHTKLEKLEDHYRTNKSNWAVIFFRGKATSSGQGLHLIVSEVSEVQETSEEQKDSIELIPNVFEISGNFSPNFPMLFPGSLKGVRRPIFVLGNPVKGMKVSVRVTNFQTELESDWLSVLWYGPESKSPQRLTKQTGTLPVGKQAMRVNLGQSEPFVLFFTSNSLRSQRVRRFGLNVQYIVDGPDR